MVLQGEARKKYARQHYVDNREKYLMRNKSMRQQREEYVRDLKAAGKCVDCHNKYHPCQMQFDHIGTDKVASISDLVRNSSIQKIKDEIEKCELVCANCHALRTWQRKQR